MKTARLFRNGQSQAVRLPKEYRFSGNRVLIKRVGKAVILLPEKGPWTPLFESLSRFSEDFMESRQQPGQQQREGLFE
ncbi:MAG: antitoxin [Deltaproteobacteria bacterium]|nr:antitoxin [Deltaproteobacteria bacterium]